MYIRASSDRCLAVAKKFQGAIATLVKAAAVVVQPSATPAPGGCIMTPLADCDVHIMLKVLAGPGSWGVWGGVGCLRQLGVSLRGLSLWEFLSRWCLP